MNDKLVVIHQPDFMPYLGFFHRLLSADVYIVLDDVQFVYGSNSWTSRDKIKTEKGAKWITISVNKRPFETMIRDVTISESIDWRSKHLAEIRRSYCEAPYFDEIYPYLENLYSKKSILMMDFTLESIKLLMKLFDIDIPMVCASCLNVEGTGNQRIANLVKAVGSSRYLSGLGAKDYFDPEVYEHEGIEVIWQDFTHPVYLQQFGEFIPFLSSIDVFFNCGIDASRRILRECIK